MTELHQCELWFPNGSKLDLQLDFYLIVPGRIFYHSALLSDKEDAFSFSFVFHYFRFRYTYYLLTRNNKTLHV